VPKVLSSNRTSSVSARWNAREFRRAPEVARIEDAPEVGLHQRLRRPDHVARRIEG